MPVYHHPETVGSYPVAGAMTRRRALGVIGGGLAAAGLTIGAGSRPASAAPAVSGVDAAAAAAELLGTPIISPNIRDAAAFGIWPDGRPVAYAVSNGLPMAFSVLDVHTGARIAAHTIVQSGSSYDLSVAPDGLVYISGFGNGHLYRYSPVDDEMVDLGIAVAGESVMLRTTVAEDGDGYTVYGGTYAHGHVFSWSPSTGLFTDYGQFVPGQTYARALTFGGGRLFIGTGTSPRLFSVDPVTWAQQEIPLPAKHASSDTFVYDLVYRRGILFVFLSPSLAWLMYDVKAGAWVNEVTNNPQSGISPSIGEDAYFVNGDTGNLFAYDLTTHQVTTTSFAEGVLDGNTTRALGAVALGGPDFPGRSVVGIGLNGRLWHWNPLTGNVRWVDGDPAGSAAEIHTIGRGPDGNMYIGGFWTAGSIARYDVGQSTMEQLPGPYQMEGLAQFGGRLYLGVYQNPAQIMAYDPAQPWDFGANPATVFSFAGYAQERPFAFAPAGDRLAIGTIAEKGHYDGALTFLDPATGAAEVHVAVVSNHGVSALAANGGMLVGGTSVQPSGVPPIESTAKLFIWDIASDQKVWEGTPVQALDYAELVFDADGTLWCLTTSGVVFAFDVVAQQVLRSTKVIPNTGTQLSQWGLDTMFFGADGKLYGSSVGRVFSLDPGTMVSTILDSSGSFAAMDELGRIYYAKTAQLYRLTPG